ncbi:MAG: zinc-binding dehydrogenase [Nevskia sp.]|nr:zinc-binding dehydrogenase [Nevskia sp.]
MVTDEAIEMHLPRKGAPEVFQALVRKLAPPGPGEARVIVEAAGVAYADIVTRQGLYDLAPLPVTPGYDLVGRIAALGPGVQGFSVGQRVAAVTVSGSYVNQRNVDARWLVPAPEHVDAGALVAAILNGLTAWQMLHRIAAPEPGEWVLVHGAAGGVGTLLLDLCKLAGVRAVGTASAGKLAVVTARGGAALDHKAGDLPRRTRELTGGGVIAAFDHIGGSHLRRVTMPSLRPGGIGILYGGYNATRDGRLNPLAAVDLMLNGRFASYRLFNRGQGVVGYSSPIWRDQRPAAYRRDLASVLALVADGRLKPLVGATFPLKEAAAAHHALETRAVSGKIVLVAS